ncbi:MAG: protein phosphatase 2C domain-containing protein [Oscillospiraceae bacterium]|nr:protein phosphatase 2C domain-containing protein [Oscillospiraceae bacterium]
MQGNKDCQQVSDGSAVFDLAISTVIGDRDEQQDSFGYELSVGEGLVVVCDGMGGMNGGKIASGLAVKEFLDDYKIVCPCEDAVTFLAEATKKASLKIRDYKLSNGERLKAGSTLVAILIQGRRLFWSSVGDSRAYLLRDSKYVQITLDQNYKTVLSEKLDAGLINETEFDNESDRAEALISYLGIENLQLIDYNNEELDLRNGDKIVVMTDGLYKIVDEAEIFAIVDNFNNISEALQALEAKAASKSRNSKNRDNMTVAIISIK